MALDAFVGIPVCTIHVGREEVKRAGVGGSWKCPDVAALLVLRLAASPSLQFMRRITSRKARFAMSSVDLSSSPSAIYIALQFRFRSKASWKLFCWL